MKTYKKTMNVPILEIRHEEDSTSPREWSNLGYFITIDNKYNSPDKNEILENVIRETGDEASDLDDHIRRIKQNCQDIVAIYLISKYEHGGVSYGLGRRNGWDYSNNGFYVITKETQKELGTKKKDFQRVIEDELDIYNKYISGEVYSFVLYDKDGEVEDSCGGFYDIEDIREHLPKGWEKESLEEYIIE